MNGLKTVWIISRHYRGDNKMEELLNLISDEIADKIESHIKITELFKLKEIPYEKYLKDSIDKIKQGIKILHEWKKQYRTTKQRIEEDNLERWDF